MSGGSGLRFRPNACRSDRGGNVWIRWVGALSLLLFFSGSGPVESTHGAWAGERTSAGERISSSLGGALPLTFGLSMPALLPSPVTKGERVQAIMRDGPQRTLLRCRGAFLVITHRAGWPLPKDEKRVRALLARIFLRLVPEWPDGLPAYPIARPTGHPVSQLLREQMFQRTVAELAHHWEVMNRRFGQKPPPVVGSARLLVRLIARQPGAVGILRVDELPAPAFWPQEARIAAVLAPSSVRQVCSQPLLEAVYTGADKAAAASLPHTMVRDAIGGGFGSGSPAEANAFVDERGPRGTVVRHKTP